MTPDPGVIEVNLLPAHNWDELVKNTTMLYEEARLSRLGDEEIHDRWPARPAPAAEITS